mmetsp:Transcript_46893/g.120933  ORF Transcript_46893/g.120933 Transcript_46893/m.120933 type:complete len:281 (-) Transcript_46893:1582-2424(-)
MAEQLATLKAALRDEAEVEKLFKSVLSILELAAGRDAAVRYSSSLRNISAALYWGTCLVHARSDTIGEEMCSITHWRDSDKRIWAKLGVALTATVFPLTAVSPLPLPHSSAVGKSLLRHILRFLDLEEATVVSIFSAIRRLLGAIFFIFGGPIQAMYYIVGARPRNVFGQQANTRKSLLLIFGLGAMTIATIDLLQAKAARRRKRTGKIVVAVPSRSHTESTPWTRSPGQSRECPLCLHSLSRPACAPCGHTFCWRCISAWVADEVSAKPSSPIFVLLKN